LQLLSAFSNTNSVNINSFFRQLFGDADWLEMSCSDDRRSTKTPEAVMSGFGKAVSYIHEGFKSILTLIVIFSCLDTRHVEKRDYSGALLGDQWLNFILGMKGQKVRWKTVRGTTVALCMSKHV
jgi:hypothetical protein